MPGRVRVFIACSIDGFIAGPDDDLSWLPQPDPNAPPDAVDESGFSELMSEVGCLLQGRNTYRVAAGFDGPWPYGDVPVLVATTRALTPKVPSVRAVQGDISALISEAQGLAGDKDVYLDGGNLIRQGLDADLIDEICITTVPVILGRGAALFAGTKAPKHLQLVSVRQIMGDLVQTRYARR